MIEHFKVPNYLTFTIRMFPVQIASLLLHVSGVLSVSIDNDLIGEPDIECMEHEIRVYVKTRKAFSGKFPPTDPDLSRVVAGRIYAKGKAEDPECAKDDFARLHTKKPRFDLSLGVCGMKSLRSVGFANLFQTPII